MNSSQKTQSLTRKAWEGITFFVVALALLLFVPAGTLWYWQGWIYLLVFSLSVISITLYLMKHDQELLQRRLKAGSMAETKKSQKLIQFVARIAFIALFVGSALDYRFYWSSVPNPIIIIGDVLVALGFFIVFLVFKENSFTAGTIEVDKKQTVISSGPYSIVHHPMYAGALIMLFGTPIALGSSAGLVAYPPMVAGSGWRLLDEEKFLSKELPGYTTYLKSVRWRLVPGIF